MADLMCGLATQGRIDALQQAQKGLDDDHLVVFSRKPETSIEGLHYPCRKSIRHFLDRIRISRLVATTS